ncbi:MAG: bifunctional folylpolyglutamate synthase/dihydrofolate synthase [Clostridia bacterium]|nr:bifunctional folylpolyglutamate synthase/dihydrofolate synthase [Clostridia bacterium]
MRNPQNIINFGSDIINYNEAINYIHSTPKFNRILGNDVLKKLLEKLGSPQKKLSFIHLAGTNGKGSTAAMISNILKTEGYKTGLFTSPYIEVFNERIQINNVNISDADLAEIVTEIKMHVDTMVQGPSEFALITAAAFLYFYRQNCDFVVLETGMGGRLDATNVIEDSLISVITSISLDHTAYLGDTIDKIAKEKCGIIKKNGTVVSAPMQNEQALEVIKNSCREKNAQLLIPEIPDKFENGKFYYKGTKYSLSLKGNYQLYNAVTALETVFALKQKGIKISDNSIKQGLFNAKWLGRFETISENPTIIIDGAHNIGAVRELKKSLNKKHITLVMAMMEDKNHTECVRELATVCNTFIATEITFPRCLPAEKLAQDAKSFCKKVIICKDPIDAVNSAIGTANPEDIICVCGSLYLVGEIRKNFRKDYEV